MEYGLIGKTLGHSFSKEIHQSFYDYDYQLMELSEDKFDDFMRARDFKGLNITIPYKKSVMSYCDTISDEGREIGSINTVVNSSGLLHGYNTDYYGFEYMLKSATISLKTRKLVILGSGGTGVMVAYAAERMGASDIIVVSREGPYNYGNSSRYSDAEIIINATPIGMYPANGYVPLDINNFNRCVGLVDVIYNPLKTQLVIDAEKKGITSINGLSMLVGQAKYAGELFTGQEDSAEERQLKIEKVVDNMEKKLSNIVLMGMPGSGKSTIGRMLAKRLKREFIDIDEKIEEKAEIPITKIFAKFGEDYFRDLESKVIKENAILNGKVISLGGGSILREVNRDIIRGNSKIIWLKRDISLLQKKEGLYQ